MKHVAKGDRLPMLIIATTLYLILAALFPFVTLNHVLFMVFAHTAIG